MSPPGLDEDAAPPETGDPVEVLRRWEGAGAVWRVLVESRNGLTIGLFTCDGGEEVARFTSADADLASYVERAGPDSL